MMEERVLLQHMWALTDRDFTSFCPFVYSLAYLGGLYTCTSAESVGTDDGWRDPFHIHINSGLKRKRALNHY